MKAETQINTLQEITVKICLQITPTEKTNFYSWFFYKF